MSEKEAAEGSALAMFEEIWYGRTDTLNEETRRIVLDVAASLLGSEDFGPLTK